MLSVSAGLDLLIVKYFRKNIYNFFIGILMRNFEFISSVVMQLAADPDINVKNGSELLDRLMKVSL